MSIPRLRDYQGPALFSYGFRPFFPAGALYACGAMVLWLPLFHGRLATLSAFAPVAWHVHEMLFGYLAAIVTGFLLAEIRNWTGRLPLQGGPLPAPVAVSRWRAPTASGGLPTTSGLRRLPGGSPRHRTNRTVSIQP